MQQNMILCDRVGSMKQKNNVTKKLARMRNCTDEVRQHAWWEAGLVALYWQLEGKPERKQFKCMKVNVCCLATEHNCLVSS